MILKMDGLSVIFVHKLHMEQAKYGFCKNESFNFLTSS